MSTYKGKLCVCLEMRLLAAEVTLTLFVYNKIIMIDLPPPPNPDAMMYTLIW